MVTRVSRCIKSLVVTALLLVQGCSGGGTIGTSQTRPARISGSVVSAQGTAAEDVIITVLETGDTATTTSDGSFVLETNLPAESAESRASLLVESQDFESKIDLGIVSDTSDEITVFLKLDSVSRAISVVSLEARDRDAPVQPDTPDVTPTPAPQATPSSGGTTGGEIQNNSSLFRGIIRDKVGKPWKGLIVTVVQNNQLLGSVTTNSEGRFSIDTKIKKNDVVVLEILYNRLLVGTAGFNITKTPVIVDVGLVVDKILIGGINPFDAQLFDPDLVRLVSYKNRPRR